MEETDLIREAAAGDRNALETLLLSVQDEVFSLSLRMLGDVQDAEDAAQEILIKVMTHLSSFRQESAFSTWVFRIAANHLIDYRKGRFSQHPLSFEAYGADICSGREKDVPDLHGVDEALLERELKLSCTNVMLQCLDAQSRCIYVLGTMFRLDSRTAADILGLTPEAYRQRLSRARAKMGAFLSSYCGLSGTGVCRCKARVAYAASQGRIDPARPAYHALQEQDAQNFTDAMERLDALSQIFADLPAYRAPESSAAWLRALLVSPDFLAVING